MSGAPPVDRIQDERSSRPRRRIAVAIQGGGSRGATAWGALDRILEDERIEIEAVAGTSSGAINACLTAYGMLDGGAPGACRALEEFWSELPGCFEPGPGLSRALLRTLTRLRGQTTGRRAFFDLMARLSQPHRIDSQTMDPLRSLIDRHVDFARLRSSEGIELFVNATNVNTSDVRVFDRREMSLNAICASSCIPFLFEPVEIGGDYFWDGGFMGNPPIFPLIYHAQTSDILLVRTGSLEARALPRTPSEILDRMLEISFNSTFLRELRSIRLLSELSAEGRLAPESGIREIRMHVIAPDVRSIGASNLDVSQDVLRKLYERGHAAADDFLREHFDDIGRRGTLVFDRVAATAHRGDA